MDCEYLLVCKSGLFDEQTFHFHAATSEEAKEQGCKIVVHKQEELEERMPSGSLSVKAVLYRGFHEFDGRDFITITPNKSL